MIFAGPVAVIGIGTMGERIARLCAASGLDVYVVDVDPQRVDLLASAVRDLNADSGAPGHIRPAALDEIAGIQDVVVVEALPECLSLKCDVLRPIVAVLPEVLLLTTTSAIPISELWHGLGEPTNLVGVHFFNPADIVPGVEIIHLASSVTSHAQLALGQFLQRLGKRAVTVADSVGFVANRLQLALLLEAIRCVEEGLASIEEVDQLVVDTIGLRLAAFGPFRLADLAGLDVLNAILLRLSEDLDSRFVVPVMVQRRVQSSNIGAKAGQGFYSYEPDDVARLIDERDEIYRRILSVRAATGADSVR